MNILAMDTSNQALGVALLKDGQLAGEIVTNIKKNHSVRLMPAVEQLMQEVGMSPEQLDRIVVAKGPGSYTGVRIGLTTAKSMAWALDIPVVGVSSLEVLAHQGRFFDGLICPFFDARRGLVFTGLYKSVEGKMQLVKEEKNIPMEAWLQELAEIGQKILFLSPDMGTHQDAVQEAMAGEAVIPEHPFHVSAPSHLAFAGMIKDADETHALTPSYLRLAEAEANWIKKQKEKQGNG